jgi:hypothetical protein
MVNEFRPRASALSFSIVAGKQNRGRLEHSGERQDIEKFGSVEILRELHVCRVIRRNEGPPEVANTPVY